MAWPVVYAVEAGLGQVESLTETLERLQPSDRYAFVMVRQVADTRALLATPIAPEALHSVLSLPGVRSDIERGSFRALQIDLAPSVRIARVEFGGAYYDLFINCQVTDPVAIAENEVYDVQRALVAYLQRAGSAVTVGGGTDTKLGAGALTEIFERHPPEFPGLSFRLEAIEAAKSRFIPAQKSRPVANKRNALANRLQLEMRFLPRAHLYGSLWISGDDAGEIKDALAALVAAHGYQLHDDGPPERGSIWQRIVATFSASIQDPDPAESREAERLYRAGEQTLLESNLRKQKREHAAQQVEATERLLLAIENQDNVVIRLADMVIVKYQGATVVDNFSPETMSRLPVDDKALLSNPQLVLEILASQRQKVWSKPDSPEFLRRTPPDRDTI